jgi:hypothetical protein
VTSSTRRWFTRLPAAVALWQRLLQLALCASLSACGNSISGPTPPTPAASFRYDGEWSGTTSQGRPISLTVSSDQSVTAITVGYSFNGCSGVNTFSNLNLAIGNPPNASSPTLGPGFGYGSGPPDGPHYTQVYGSFTSSTTATGSVIFGDYPGCGNSGAIWSATKR